MTEKPSSALAVRTSDSLVGTEPWRDPDWQKLWLALQSRPWSSLAVVPASTGAAPDLALSVAGVLARIGIMHLGVPIQVADATQIPLVHLAQLDAEVQRIKQEQERVLIAVAPTSQNPASVPIAKSADAAMLCVVLEEMSSSEAKKTVNSVGAQRFVGSAIFHPNGTPVGSQ